MQKWEYLTILTYAGYDFPSRTITMIDGNYVDSDKDGKKLLVPFLKELGEQGWELVSVTDEPSDYQAYYFKRPIE